MHDDAIVNSCITIIIFTVSETMSPSTATSTEIVASTNVWFPVAMAMVTIAIIALLVMVISVGVMVCMINRNRKYNIYEGEWDKLKCSVKHKIQKIML